MSFEEGMREAVALFRRGKVTRSELYTLLLNLNIDRRFWRAIEREWRGSKRMAVPRS